ncbi:MAG: DUF87 domain-containing protein [Clostridia bacterium]|nr:DUF87 domain-containing protein [Clostridia bacterium]
MANGVKSKNGEKSAGFLREVFGLAVIVFVILCYVCLITGDGLFYSVGLAVGNFLYGVFGVYAYLFLFHVGYFGVTLVYGKSLIPKQYRPTVYVVRAAVVCVFLILHASISFDGSLQFGAELSKAYESPFVAGAHGTVGGAAASLLVLPLSLIVSKIGAIIVFVVILLLLIGYLFRNRIAAVFAGGEGKTRTERKNKKVKKAADGDEDAQKEAEADRPQVTNFFFNERSGFNFRTKREAAEERRRLPQPFTGTFETKTIVDVARREVYDRARNTSPSQTRPAPVRADATADYRETQGFDGGREPFSPDRSMRSPSAFNGSPTRMTNGPQPEKKSEKPEFDNFTFGKDVYTIPVGSTRGARYDKDVATPDDYRESAVGGENDGAYGGGAYSERRPLNQGAGAYNERVTEVKTVASAGDSFYEPHSGGDNDDDFGGNVYTPITGEEKPTGFSSVSDGTRYTSAARTSSPKPFTPAMPADKNMPSPDGRPAQPFRPTAAQPFAATGAPLAPTSVAKAMPPQSDFDFDENEEDMEDGYSFIPTMPLNYKYNRPRLDLLADYTPDADAQWAEKSRQEFCKQKIIAVFKLKGIDVQVVNVVSGSTVTRYDIAIPEDVSLSDVRSCKTDLAFRLKTKGEFNMDSIPGTDLIGIEIASDARRTVGMRSVFENRASKKVAYDKGVFFMLGEDVLGTPIFLNLAKLPHLLICGATGTGKSVCLNTMLVSLMYNYGPDELRFIIVDPKLVEFKAFEGIPHLVFDHILGFDESGKSTKAIAVLEWAVQEMERRYLFFTKRGYKDIKEYNSKIDTKTEKKVPYLIVLIDEFADFIMTSPENKKTIDNLIGRIAQKARAAGIMLILATQRPSADIMSGNIKANIPSRICFKTSSAVDSRVVLDDGRAEKLLSMGDCLYKTSDDSTLRRAQGAFISNDELKDVVRYIKEHNKCYFDNSILDKINKAAAHVGQDPETDEEDLPSPKASAGGRMMLDPDAADDVTKRSLRIAIKVGYISTSLLRTYLRIGYNRANSIVIWMERMNYITSPLENQKRNTLMTKDQYEQVYGEFVEDF